MHSSKAHQLAYVDTFQGQVQVYADCRVELYSVEGYAAGDPPSILLPHEFPADQWQDLSAEERNRSLAADRLRLLQRVRKLERKNTEYLVVLVMCVVCVVIIGWMSLIYMRH